LDKHVRAYFDRSNQLFSVRVGVLDCTGFTLVSLLVVESNHCSCNLQMILDVDSEYIQWRLLIHIFYGGLKVCCCCYVDL